MYARRPTWLALFLSLVAFLALAQLGHAAPAQWQEVHAAGVDVRVSVDRAGPLRAEYRLSYRVVAGTLRGVELELDSSGDALAFDPQGTVVAEDGSTLPLFVVSDKGKLHLSVDDAKGLKRGNYTFVVHADGNATQSLRYDGAFLELSFRAPAQREGIDGMRVVFDLPSAPTEPQAKSDGAADDAVLSTLRRKADRDELELVRPHVARSEGAVFRVRVDKKALSTPFDAALRPPPKAEASAKSDPSLRWAFVGFVGLALLLVLRAKISAVRARARAVELRGLVPIAATWSPYAAALAFGAAIHAQITERHLLGGALLGCALVLAAVRARPRPSPVMAPGSWSSLDPATVFGKSDDSASPFDGTRARGRWTFLAVMMITVVVAVVATRLRADAPYLVLLDASILVPIFFTATEVELGATTRRTTELLRHCFDALAKSGPVAAVGHVPRGAKSPDEVRLLSQPKLAMPGVVGIELGVAWDFDGGAPAPRYGVLVRVLDGSFAAAKMAAELEGVARPVTGRRPEERVYPLWPRLPLAGAAVGLVDEVSGLLRDRRKTIAGEADWSGKNRREAGLPVEESAAAA